MIPHNKYNASLLIVKPLCLKFDNIVVDCLNESIISEAVIENCNREQHVFDLIQLGVW